MDICIYTCVCVCTTTLIPGREHNPPARLSSRPQSLVHEVPQVASPSTASHCVISVLPGEPLAWADHPGHAPSVAGKRDEAAAPWPGRWMINRFCNHSQIPVQRASSLPSSLLPPPRLICCLMETWWMTCVWEDFFRLFIYTYDEEFYVIIIYLFIFACASYHTCV